MTFAIFQINGNAYVFQKLLQINWVQYTGLLLILTPDKKSKDNFTESNLLV